MKIKGWLWTLGLAALASPLAAETYKIDPAHSGVSFRVAHLVVSKVTGRFEKFQGSVEYVKGKAKTWKAEAVIEAASINTNVADRDKHLRSADFLDAEKFPELTFKSVKVVGGKGNKAKLIGDLTIRGVTQRVTLDLEIGGTIQDPWGNQRLGATARTKISRKDFGLTWNKILEAGGVVVGDEIEISLEIEAIAQK